MGKFVFAIMITATLVINAPSSAFGQLGDGQQKGFQLGAGGVVGHTTINYSGGGTDDALSYGANLYIGYGLTNQSIVSFRYRWTWIDTDSPYQGLVWSADYRHFFSENGKAYLSAGLGPAMSVPEFGDPKSGFAFYGGLGYELSKYIFLNGDFTYTSLSDGLSGTAILVAINFIKY